MRKLLRGAGLVIVLGSPLPAQTAGPSPVATPAPEEITVTGKIPDGQKKVCQTTAATGSILIKRVCRTKQEWEDIRIRSLAALERMKKQEDRDAHTRATMLEGQ